MKPLAATRRHGGRSRRRVHVVVVLAALGLAASDTVFLEARPPVMRFEVEDNNTQVTATPFAMSGNYGIATGTIGTAGDVDYWFVPGPPSNSGSNFYISILCDTGGVQTAGATSRRVVLSLIDGDETVEVDSGDGTGTGGDGTIETSDAAAIGPRILRAGSIYYIRISAVGASDVVSPYRLLVAMTPVARSEREVNDDVQSADPIAAPNGWPPVSSGIGVRTGVIDAPGDVDYYSIRATAGDVLFFAAGVDYYSPRATAGDVLFFAAGNPNFLLDSSEGPPPAVDLLAPDGVTELLSLNAASAGSEGDPPTESANFSVPTSGLYFLRVHDPSGTGSRHYLLMVAVRPFSDAVADFDSDFHTDFAIYSSQGVWIIEPSTDDHPWDIPWGEPMRDDIPVPADYDGYGLADVAVYRNTTGQWIIRANGGQITVIDWGAPWLGDIPVPGDYDGDGKNDVAVYRKSTGDWFIRFAAGGSAWHQWGAPWLDDLPVPADYDGDGVTDVAVYRNATGQWFIAYSGGGAAAVDWGAPWLSDVPVPADYDGDGAADVAVYRKSTGEWFIQYAAGGTAWFPLGEPWNDIPVPGDYDGDGSTDVATYRPSTAVFFVRPSHFNYPVIFQWSMTGPNYPPVDPNAVPVNRPVAVR